MPPAVNQSNVKHQRHFRSVTANKDPGATEYVTVPAA
jgi:hypothetical protein